MLENARAAEAADRYAESVEQSTKQATNSVNKPARNNFESNMKKETGSNKMKKTSSVGNVEDNGLTQVVRAREKENVETVDMTGRILKKNRARQKARNENLVDCSIILVNVAEIPMPDHLQSKSTRDKSMTKRAQVTSLHGQSVHQDRMTGHSPT
jgi:hypothetical protein